MLYSLTDHLPSTLCHEYSPSFSSVAMGASPRVYFTCGARVRPIDCYGHRSRMAEPCSIRPIDTARALRNVGPHATTSSRVRAFSANCCASEGFLVKGLSRKSCRRIGLIMTRLLLVRVLVWVFIASLVPAGGRAQTHSGFPVDIVAGPPPQPLASEGRTWLVYALHLTN